MLLITNRSEIAIRVMRAAAEMNIRTVAIDSMKMETHIAAEYDCEIAEVHVHPGDRVAAKDLMITLKERG